MAYLMILTLSAAPAVSLNPEKNTADKPADKDKNKKEYKLSDEEAQRLTRRVEEIKKMDRSKMTVKEKREIRKELKTIKKRYDGYVIYFSSGTILLIVILILLI